MADINITCSKCKKVISVSEFADQNLLTCRSCGEKLIKPQTATPKPMPTVRRIKLKEQKNNAQEPKKDTSISKKRKYPKPAKEPKETKEPVKMSHYIASWIIFFILGGAMAFMRYGSSVNPVHIELIKKYGPIILLVLHITIILKAFKDSVFNGILCLLIPPYSLYYLFSLSDDFYMRAIVGGILIGIGQDSAIVINEKTKNLFDIIHAWFARGG